MHARNMRESVARIHEGLPVAAALVFKDTLGLTNSDLAQLLGVSVRTLARWTQASRLDPVAGDRLDRASPDPDFPALASLPILGGDD